MMTKQPITKKLAVPAEVVWQAIRNIGRLDVWFPFIESCRVEGEGQGALRYLTIVNGGGDIHGFNDQAGVKYQTLQKQK